MLSIFALVVLVVLIVAGCVLATILGGLPGKIARERRMQQVRRCVVAHGGKTMRRVHAGLQAAALACLQKRIAIARRDRDAMHDLIAVLVNVHELALNSNGFQAGPNPGSPASWRASNRLPRATGAQRWPSRAMQ